MKPLQITFDQLEQDEIQTLYSAVGWSAYTNDMPRLMRALRNSIYLSGVRDEKGKLIGLLRAIGDGETIIYIQDILVLPEHQRKGIGRQLIEAILGNYKDVRQKVLMTDDDPKTEGFYTSIGFKKCKELRLMNYMYMPDNS